MVCRFQLINGHSVLIALDDEGLDLLTDEQRHTSYCI